MNHEKRTVYRFSVLMSLTLVGLMMLAAFPPLGLAILGLVVWMLVGVYRLRTTKEQKAHNARTRELRRRAAGRR